MKILTTDELIEIKERFNLRGVNIPVAMREVEALVLAKLSQQEPVAHLKFWAAQRATQDGNVDAAEGLEVCEAGDIGMDRLPAIPVFARPVPAAPTDARKEIALNIIRKWPEGFEARLQHVWLDVVGFIPNVKLYDLQRMLSEFGFTMAVYEAAPTGEQATPADARTYMDGYTEGKAWALEAAAVICDEQLNKTNAAAEKAKSVKARDIYSGAAQTIHWVRTAIRALKGGA